jgi:hypothetical protein
MPVQTPPAAGLSAEDKRLFRAALIYLGYTRETWAAEHGFSTSYVDQVRGGFVPSPTILKMVAHTIARFQKAVADDAKASRGRR